MKKLIPALCMLLVAACLMGTSTYAWFAANTTVTASGMAVQAAADGGLAIASYEFGATNNNPVVPGEDDFAASASAIWTNQRVYTAPTATGFTVSPTSFDGSKWWTASANTANNGAAVAPTPGAAVYTEVANLAEFAQHTMWQIKSLDTTAQTYKLNVAAITITGENAPSANLNNALRIAIKVTPRTLTDGAPAVDADDNPIWNDTAAQWTYFAPLSDATTFKYTNGTAVQTYATMNKGAITDPVQIWTGLDQVAVKVDVYVYYEGEDPDCKSANIALDVDTLGIQITYSATK